MPLIAVYFTASLFILYELQTIQCYSYQTKPLFLSFSELAALEGSSLDHSNTATSHFGDHRVKTFVVTCQEDSIEVAIKAYLFDPGLPVEPKHLSLGPAGAVQLQCTARVSENGEYIIRAPLTDCGSEVTFTQSAVLYNNLLLYSPPPSSPGDGAALPVHCEYRRRYSVSSSALKPTWSPLVFIHSAHLQLDFHLRLMTDDWSSERKSSVYFLSETVNIEASVDDRHHLPLRLYVDRCVATLTSDVNSYPSYPFIDHQGCFTDSQLQGSSSRFLPRVQDQLLQIQLEPFLFHQDHRHTIYITCYLEAEPVSKKEPVKKACSFKSGRWRSVDGDDHLCESCNSTAKSSHKRVARSKTKRRQTDSLREIRFGPVTFLPSPESTSICTEVISINKNT